MRREIARCAARRDGPELICALQRMGFASGNAGWNFAGSRNKSCNLLYDKFGRGVRVPARMTIADLCLSIRHQGAYSTMMRSQFGHDADFYCPHCGALFVVSYTKLPIADSGSEYCECCKRRMIQWNSALQPRYRLVQRSDPAQR
jgi:hypothetical protein